MATLSDVETLATNALGGPYTLILASGPTSGPYVSYVLVNPTERYQIAAGGKTIDEWSALLTAAAGTSSVPVTHI